MKPVPFSLWQDYERLDFSLFFDGKVVSAFSKSFLHKMIEHSKMLMKQ